MACTHPNPEKRLFCPVCGKADRQELASVRFAGFLGRHTMNENIQRALATGDATGL